MAKATLTRGQKAAKTRKKNAAVKKRLEAREKAVEETKESTAGMTRGQKAAATRKKNAAVKRRSETRKKNAAVKRRSEGQKKAWKARRVNGNGANSNGFELDIAATLVGMCGGPNEAIRVVLDADEKAKQKAARKPR